jgi:hypothetical protein
MWRRIMLTGAVVLLIGSLVPALMGDDAPAWVPNATLIIGYGFLAYGFFKAMRAKNAPREMKVDEAVVTQEEEKS